MIAPALTLVCAGAGALLGARAWRLALAAVPPAPPSSGPGSGPDGPGSPGTDAPAPPFPGRRPDARRGGRRVPVPAGRAADAFDGGDRPPDGSTRTWWA
jgi:hypothetical protein